MLIEPHTYRFSTIRLVVLIIILILLGLAPFIFLGSDYGMYAIVVFAVIGLIILISTFALTRSTTITDDGISARSLLGERYLNWGDIASVSGRGKIIKLHNRDGDVTVSPSPQLPGYTEVVETIGAKRPDLFKSSEYPVMSRNWQSIFSFFSIAGIFIYGSLVGTAASLEAFEDLILPIIFIAVVILAFIAIALMSVLSLKLDGSSLTIQYLFRKAVLKPEDVGSIGLDIKQTRNGKSYHIVIFTKHNRTVRFSGLGPSLPIVYLVLKNWHQGRMR